MRFFPWLNKRNESASPQKSRANSSTFVTEDDNKSQLQGRTYLKDLSDMFPRDLQEVSRLDFQHYLVKTALRGNYLAPLQAPVAIVDVGCGSGRWAQEMAVMFPQARVFGLDVDPMVGRTNLQGAPANYQFVQGNVLTSLPYPDFCFDFVHQQLLSGSVPATAWPAVLRELVRVTRVNGWVELVESNIVVQNMGPQLQQLTTWCLETCRRLGIDLSIGTRLGQDLQAAGLYNISTRNINLPIGNWGGRVGRSGTTALTSLFVALKPMIISQLSLRSDLFDRTLQAVESELEQQQCWATFYVAYGQRGK